MNIMTTIITLIRRRFYTQMLLHTDAFTHRRFYTQTLLHTEAFPHRHFYTQRLLHKEAFTQSDVRVKKMYLGRCEDVKM